MHGLIGDRFLKWFVGSLKRQPRTSQPGAKRSETTDNPETISRPDIPENDTEQGKEEPKQVERTNITDQLNQPSGTTHETDDPQDK